MNNTKQNTWSKASLARFIARLLAKGYIKTIEEGVIKIWHKQEEGNISILLAKERKDKQYQVVYDKRFIG